MPRCGCACLIALVATAACGGGGSPTAPSAVASSGSAGSAGVQYDNIQVSHQFIVGSPMQTQDQATTYCCWPLPVRNPGIYTFDIASFPLDVLPSGGSSNVISSSEMILVGMDHTPAVGTVTFEWHRAVGSDTVVYTYDGATSFSWSYSFIGHFSWEIVAAGAYYVIVSTPWGNARLNFAVSNSSSSLTTTGQTSSLFVPRAAVPWNVHGGGGGGGVSIVVASGATTR